MCWDGNSGSWRAWGKNRQEKAFWVLLGGGELEITDLGSGMGLHSLVYPRCTVFGAQVLGFYLRLENMSSPRSETEWANRFTGLFIHTTLLRVGLGRVEFGKCGTIPASRIEGISGGEVGVRPPSLSASPVWPHGSI
jgi:hypothetical protein